MELFRFFEEGNVNRVLVNLKTMTQLVTWKVTSGGNSILDGKVRPNKLIIENLLYTDCDYSLVWKNERAYFVYKADRQIDIIVDITENEEICSLMYVSSIRNMPKYELDSLLVKSSLWNLSEIHCNKLDVSEKITGRAEVFFDVCIEEESFDGAEGNTGEDFDECDDYEDENPCYSVDHHLLKINGKYFRFDKEDCEWNSYCYMQELSVEDAEAILLGMKPTYTIDDATFFTLSNGVSVVTDNVDRKVRFLHFTDGPNGYFCYVDDKGNKPCYELKDSIYPETTWLEKLQVTYEELSLL